MKKKIKNQKQIENVVLTDNDEPMIDGKRLSEVFDVQGEDTNIKIEKKKSDAAKDFEINFDPNADVVLKKKKTKWQIVRSCIAWLFVIVFGSVAGYFVGDIIVAKLDVYDPNAFSSTALKESEETIALWKTKDISLLTAGQIFVVAESNLNECEYYSITTKGLNGREKGLITNPVAPQDFWGYRYRNGDDGFFSYNSTGIMSVIKDTRFKFSGGDLECHDGVSGATTMKSAEEYLEEVGCAATSPVDYIVSSKTVLTEEKVGSENGRNTYKITLSATKSVSNYVKKMKYMSGLADYPKFNSIEITFTVDDDMNFIEYEVREEYKVNYGITVTCQGEFKYEFKYEDIEIV